MAGWNRRRSSLTHFKQRQNIAYIYLSLRVPRWKVCHEPGKELPFLFYISFRRLGFLEWVWAIAGRADARMRHKKLWRVFANYCSKESFFISLSSPPNSFTTATNYFTSMQLLCRSVYPSCSNRRCSYIFFLHHFMPLAWLVGTTKTD